MRALVYAHGSLKFDPNYPEPVLKDGEALVRVLQAGICNTDLEIVRGYMGFTGVLGHEFVGIVEEVPDKSGIPSADTLVGQHVVGEINAACHRADCFYCQQNMPTPCPNRTTLGIVNRDGAFAEYLTLPVENLHRVPDNVIDEEAVFVEPLAEKRGVRTSVLNDVQSFTLENGRRVDMVVECSGSAQGLEMALRLVRPRGTLILKSILSFFHEVC